MATSQEAMEQRQWRVVAEFEKGESVYGFEGFCVKASVSESGETKLVLLGSGMKGTVERQSVF